MSRANVETFLRVLAAFQRGEFDEWFAAFHPEGDFVPQRAPIQGAYRGHEGLREFLADNAENFDLFLPSYDEVHDVEDHVLALGKIRIRGKGGGVEIEVPSALVLTFRDGLIVRFEDLVERRRALEAVGLDEGSPPPG